MSALAWWLIPLGATLLALVWAAMRSRPRRAVDPHSSIADMDRFRAAMGRPLPDGGVDDPARTPERRPVRRPARPAPRPPARSATQRRSASQRTRTR